MSYKYKVVGFKGRLQEKDSIGLVSEQLASKIENECTDGWEFFQLSDVILVVKPGCISTLMGKKDSYITQNQLIFRKIS